MPRWPLRYTLFPYTTLFRSEVEVELSGGESFTVGIERLHLEQDAGKLQPRSEEHTSELQSHSDLVCRLLLEKKKIISLKRQNKQTHIRRSNRGSVGVVEHAT